MPYLVQCCLPGTIGLHNTMVLIMLVFCDAPERSHIQQRSMLKNS